MIFNNINDYDFFTKEIAKEIRMEMKEAIKFNYHYYGDYPSVYKILKYRDFITKEEMEIE